MLRYAMTSSNISQDPGRSNQPLTGDTGTRVQEPGTEHNVWFMTDALSPIAITLTKNVLDKGDYVVLGVLPEELKGSGAANLKRLIDAVQGDGVGSDSPEVHESDSEDEDDEEEEYKEEEASDSNWKQRFRVLPLDARSPAQSQSAVAEAVETFGRIDVLFLCRSEVLVGAVEELGQTPRTRALVTEQFETNFFSPVNMIKQVLPTMRSRKNGHIIALSGTTGHLGTPGLGLYCSSQWALEGYCDSLAYEVAPFNIRITIVQPNIEVGVLTSKLTSAPPLQDYSNLQAPLARKFLSKLLQKSSAPGESASSAASQRFNLMKEGVTVVKAHLPTQMQTNLIAETVHALSSIGGIENPPARLIVGQEAVGSVKEKLRAVMEELEDFLDVSEQVDIAQPGSQSQFKDKDGDITNALLELEDLD